jgi:calcineurin-like phosphoesterase family protein
MLLLMIYVISSHNRGVEVSNTFVISDTHFGHVGVTQFLRDDGSKLRPWDNVEEMDEALVSNWNSVVRPKDKVYHLGDVVINRKHLNTLYRLNGDKVLIKGNHDIFSLEDYTKHFRDIRAYHVMNKIIFSHIPIHPDSKGRFKSNVHGHLHYHLIKDKHDKPDPWYINVSVEQINYTPISLDLIYQRVAEID